MEFTLKDLKKKIDEKERELDELKSAYKVMERLGLMDITSPSISDNKSTPNLGDTGVINFDDLDLPPKATKSDTSLSANVENIIRRFDYKEFNVNHVYAALKKLGKVTDAKHFKNRVSIIIRKLSDEGVIERTHKGRGSDPHRYKQARQVSLVKRSVIES